MPPLPFAESFYPSPDQRNSQLNERLPCIITFYNDSTGEGEDGEIDARGPWNQGDDWKFVEAPAFDEGVKTSARKTKSSAKSGLAKKQASK